MCLAREAFSAMSGPVLCLGLIAATFVCPLDVIKTMFLVLGLPKLGDEIAKVTFLGQLRHANLVKLIGYCCEEEERLLVYEFMPKDSLENHLFRRISASPPRTAKLKIAIGAVKGLTFLHETEIPVIYRDFKTSNVLLDSEVMIIYRLLIDFVNRRRISSNASS